MEEMPQRVLKSAHCATAVWTTLGSRVEEREGGIFQISTCPYEYTSATLGLLEVIAATPNDSVGSILYNSPYGLLQGGVLTGIHIKCQKTHPRPKTMQLAPQTSGAIEKEQECIST